MLERKIALFVLASGLLTTGCPQKEYYVPSRVFYREGVSFKETCAIAQNKLKVLLPELCSDSQVSEQRFTCNETTINYEDIKRLVLVDNKVGEYVLYISLENEEYALVGSSSKGGYLKEVADALHILKNCSK